MARSARSRLVSRAYVASVVVAGGGAIAYSVHDLYAHPVDPQWLLLAALTLLSGSITVKIPSVSATLSVSEAFVFTSVLMFGPSAGTTTAALDGLIISLWLQRKGQPIYRVLFNATAPALSLWTAAHLFFLLAGDAPLAVTYEPLSSLLIPLGLFTATYFILNSVLIAVAIGLEQGVSALGVWRENFLWLSLNFFSGASVAALFVAYAREAELVTALWVIVPLLVVSYLTYKTSMGRVDDANQHLLQLNSLYMSTIETLAMAIDAKDQITHGHIRRVQRFAVSLARELGVSEDSQIRAIEAASLLHDMGKLAVPDYILNKPGPLSAAEFEKMKLHASVGADILSAINFPYPVVPIVRHHHENWDGTGYPDGLRAEAIPIGARILSVVDCFDALTSDRPYRPRLGDSSALQIIRQRRGSMYDPAVVDRFLDVHGRLVGTQVQGVDRTDALTAITEAAKPSGDTQTQLRLEEIAASSEEMLTLYQIARTVGGPFTFEDAAGIIARHLRRLIPATYCVFFVYDERTDDLYAAHAAGDSTGVFADLRIALGQRLTGWVGANRQTIINSDPVLDLGEAARVMRPPLRSSLSTPLLADNALVGALTLYSTAKDAFNDNHRRIIEAVARQVAGTLLKALRFEEQKRSSLRDDLTGLPSIERLRYITEHATEKPDSEPDSASIILVDVDGLSSINQRFGRTAGDDIVAMVAGALKHGLQGTELLFRNTSDEFVIFLARTDRDSAERRARALATAVSEAAITSPIPDQVVSVSVAVASVPADGSSMEIALAVAQRRLHPASQPGSPSPGSNSIH